MRRELFLAERIDIRRDGWVGNRVARVKIQSHAWVVLPECLIRIGIADEEAFRRLPGIRKPLGKRQLQQGAIGGLNLFRPLVDKFF